MSESIVVAVIAGLLGPVIVPWLQQRSVCRRQRRLEMKHSVFKDAVRAEPLVARRPRPRSSGRQAFAWRVTAPDRASAGDR